ncbi:MAG TPA: prepilin-type N-terminal cleavage/methylation domain-containing protein [Spirochaetia bacterium]|nr:prepilin-type N-terminal cleavage/methylation domain-containing protein [Spirochaetia bacterium]
MIRFSKGYTLIELVMAVSLLVIVLLGGTSIFYQSFKSSGVSDIQASLNNSLRSLEEMIEGSLRYGKVTRVYGDSGNKIRSDCLVAGDFGVSGYLLEIQDPSGGVAVYTLLSDGTVSSNSGVIISNPDIYVTKLEFRWYCKSGVYDKMNLSMEATASGNTTEVTTATLVKDISLLNSGIY